MSEVSLTILFVITCDSGLYLSDANHDSAPAERVINKNPPLQYFFWKYFFLPTPDYQRLFIVLISSRKWIISQQHSKILQITTASGQSLFRIHYSK
jgi:hypothetical protein